MESIFAVNKPKGITSHDVIDILRRETGERRIGHAGTLDPLAEGVLVVAVGRDATKQLATIVAKEKEYIAKVHFGASSTTDDNEGEKTNYLVQHIPTIEEVIQALSEFNGEFLQVPPAFSAIKVGGEALYKSARRGERVVPKPRTICIKEIEVESYKWPLLTIRVVTGPGVYIRSLARDIGKKLGVGGYLDSLVRTRVGNFTLENARQMKN